MAILIKKDNDFWRRLHIKDNDNSKKGSKDQAPALTEAGFLLKRIAGCALRTFVTFQINNLSEPTTGSRRRLDNLR
jgi:hypothetical protein